MKQNRSMQRRRNIKFIIILIGLIIVTVGIWFATRPEDKLKVSRDIFAYEDASAIDKVIFSGNDDEVVLSYNGRQWQVEEGYDTDPQRVSVLFAILKQMRVRRKVSKQQQDSISAHLRQQGVEVAFYEGDKKVHDFVVWGDDNSRMTYIAESPEDPAFIVEIPGYRSYLAGIYQLDANEWRDPIVFKMNWRNLLDVKVIYPGEEKSSFEVVYDNDFYKIAQVDNTDTTRLTNFLDEISLLFANKYLNKQEKEEYKDLITTVPQASVQVRDVGNKVHTLEIYSPIPGNQQIIGRVDSADYVMLDIGKVRKILRPKSFFVKKKE